MYYYEVSVATKNRLNHNLVYKSVEVLSKYQLVEVPVRSRLYLGFMAKICPGPELSSDLKHKCRQIRQVSLYKLPEKLVDAVLNLSRQLGLTTSEIAHLLLNHASLKSLAAPPVGEADLSLASPPRLTPDQTKVYRQITKLQTCQPQLLLGVNASGKTRLYAELIKHRLQGGYSALILVPEIGLSTQILQLLKTYLAYPIHHFHSKLTPKQRQVIWQKCLTTDTPLIIVGPRSASFLPLSNLGLIILDECHDDSFKQERQPMYHCLPLASSLAKQYQAWLVCGSATPKVEDYYHFQRAKYPIHYLPQRALVGYRPEIMVVDKHQSPDLFSQQALGEIIKTLTAGHQVLIFYNRRGHWRLVQCNQCQTYLRCLACQRILVFHQDRFKLVCHGCGQVRRPLSACDVCHQSLTYTYAGIKSVRSILEKHLMAANLNIPIWRFDSDNLKSQTLQNQLAKINQSQALVILGTQVISQGLDLPNLQTVVILNADQSLITPDYRMQERYYRHIHQLSGRVGRGHLKLTKVVLQTFRPQDSVLKYALNQDWQSFYNEEIKHRQAYHLPPFTYLANIAIRSKTQAKTKQTANELHQTLKQTFKNLHFYPPAPALQEKRGSYWEWLIHVSASKPRYLWSLANYFKNCEHVLNLNPNQLFNNEA